MLTQRSTATLLDLTYTRNAKGLITAIAPPNATRAWAYTYDGIDRLTLADNQTDNSLDRSYGYDDADNMTYNSGLCAANPNLVYAAGAHPHAPTSICGTAVTYDANGNTLSYDPDGSAGAIQPRTITYDGENRPISPSPRTATRPASTMAPTVSAPPRASSAKPATSWAPMPTSPSMPQHPRGS
ncbi:hypothetical protein [Aestuariivirga sp.]|uniref:hypothetical protein n=1 Tax=Aestuariivirga sp. TaxID=2650926 RepID=UPI003BABDAE3